MSDVEAWDADDFEPELPSRPAFDDKWEGEDEDDNVKDNWEDEDEEEAAKLEASGKEKAETQAYQRPKKKPLAERIAEKEAQKQKEREEEEAKEKEEKKELTSEEKLAEKIRIQKIQEKESLDLAKGLFGVQERKEQNLDNMLPSTGEEFDQFREALKSKIQFFEESPHYQTFLSKLLNNLAVDLGVEEVKKLGISLNSLYHEKDRQRKEVEKKKKKKSKVNIKVDRADDFDLISDATGGGYYDDDDFI